jgi:hypothetical protein
MIEARIASLTDLWVKKLSHRVLVNCTRCSDDGNGMVVLQKPDYFTAKPQCCLSDDESWTTSFEGKTFSPSSIPHVAIRWHAKLLYSRTVLVFFHF